MKRNAHSQSLERINESIVNGIAELFAEPELDNDGGEVRCLDRDEKCVWLGLFSTDTEGKVIGDEPTVIWTIEISHEQSGM